MANTKKFVVKNGLQTQNVDFVSPNEANTIQLSMLDTDTLSVSGNSGQLFSITDSLNGTIFAVNDISGVPSIEVDDDGTIRFAETFGNVLIGTSTDDGVNKLQVAGNISVTGTVDGRDLSVDGAKLDGIAAGAEVNQNAFSNIAVSGQTTVAADSKTDTLTLIAGTNVTITTDAVNDSITISANGTSVDWSEVQNKPDPVVTVTLTGDVTGSGNTTLTDLTSGTISFATTIAANSVALGTDTTGNYVAGLTAGTGIAVTGTAGEGWSPTVALASAGTAGTYTKVTTDAYGRVTSGTTLAASDIPALDASKITSGTIDAARLPSYVDDVLEFTNLASFPVTGETGKIYVALDTNKTYRWGGSSYVYITSSGAVDSVAGKTGVVTLTNADVGLGNVENKSSATIRGEITSTNVISALGFTPYNSTNPNGYTSNTGTVTSVSGTGTASGLTLSGTVTSTGSLTLSGTVNALAAGTYGISISGNAATAASAGYITSTNIGKTGSQGFISTTSWTAQTWADQPISGLGMTIANTPGAPNTNYGFFNKFGNRDTGGPGWGGMWMEYDGGSLWYGATTISTNYAGWKKVLDSGNYNSYAPTLTGSGASGTWGINITGSSSSCTGNAATATKLQTARTINGTSFDGSANITTANWGTARTLTIGNTGKSVNGSANVSWSLAEIGAAAATATVNLTGNQTIGGVKTFSSRVVSSAAVSGAYVNQDDNEAPFFATVSHSGSSYCPVIKIRGTGAANTSTFSAGLLHNPDNTQAGVLHFIQAADANNRAWLFRQTGDFVSPGNVTAFSDIRLKTDLQPIPEALDKVKALTGYTYTRIDTGERQTGLIAQDVQKVLPEAVVEGEHLSLAYGNMVGLLVEAIKELKAEVDHLRAQING